MSDRVPLVTISTSAPFSSKGAKLMARKPMRRIGIDVGGTNTDAVMLEDGGVAHAVKTPTTSDVTTGIVTALAEFRAARTSRAAGSTAS
jgi:activator of 2-hydroxyglutaryl-CoA dehydratase